jgi:hypothetical protein
LRAQAVPERRVNLLLQTMKHGTLSIITPSIITPPEGLPEASAAPSGFSYALVSDSNGLVAAARDRFP